MINIAKNLLVNVLVVSVVAVMLTFGNALCQDDVPTDVLSQQDVLSNDDDDSVARKLVEEGIIENVDRADIWDANFTSNRETPSNVESIRIRNGMAHRDVQLQSPSGASAPTGASSANAPSAVNAVK